MLCFENYFETCAVIVAQLTAVKFQWGAAPLEDNLPSDKYHYQMTVYTGTKKQAGTISKISFILSGDESDTGVRRLFDGKRKVNNSNFTLTISIRLFHCTDVNVQD